MEKLDANEDEALTLEELSAVSGKLLYSFLLLSTFHLTHLTNESSEKQNLEQQKM